MESKMIQTDNDGERLIETGTGKIYVRRHDPHGFWSISFEKGPIPASLEGWFTLPTIAHEKVKNYLETNKARLSQLKNKE